MFMKKLFLNILFFIPIIAYGEDDLTGIGKVALNILDPVSIVADFLGSASLIIGCSCLFAAILKYIQHRTNPHAAPLSTIITLLAMGIALVGLPFLYLLTEHGVPYSLFNWV